VEARGIEPRSDRGQPCVSPCAVPDLVSDSGSRGQDPSSQAPWVFSGFRGSNETGASTVCDVLKGSRWRKSLGTGYLILSSQCVVIVGTYCWGTAVLRVAENSARFTGPSILPSKPVAPISFYKCHSLRFRERYKGEFVIYVTLIRGVNDNPDSIGRIKDVITKLDPSRIFVETFEDEKFCKAFGVSAQKLSECSKVILGN